MDVKIGKLCDRCYYDIIDENGMSTPDIWDHMYDVLCEQCKKDGHAAQAKFESSFWDC
jgi:hypothetical protein